MRNSRHLKSLCAAFPHTIPIMTGFLFLGFTYGVLMNTKGFGIMLPLIISIFVFAGSMQFVMVDLLLSVFNPLQAFLMTLMVNARHLFYGIALLDKYKSLGKKKPYMIFGLTDESFSVNCSANIPEGIDKGLFMFWVTLLNHIYWVTGTILGSVLGSFIPFSTEGLDFVLTAMFVVIYLERFLSEKDHTSSICGIILSLICLLIFGADSFIIPSMLVILIALTLMRGALERGGKI